MVRREHDGTDVGARRDRSVCAIPRRAVEAGLRNGHVQRDRGPNDREPQYEKDCDYGVVLLVLDTDLQKGQQGRQTGRDMV